MSDVVHIYTLSDPRDGNIRYVGKTNNLRTRLVNHFRENYKGRKVNWIKSLKNKGLKPIIESIDEVPESEWKFWEKHYISLFKSWGFPLCNDTDGGEGQGYWKGRKIPEEARRNMSIAAMGRTPWNKGAKTPPDIIEKTASKLRGRVAHNKGKKQGPVSEEVKAKRADGMRRFWDSEDGLKMKEKISREHTGKRYGSETRTKMSAAQTGRIITPEMIEKCRQTKIKRGLIKSV